MGFFPGFFSGFALTTSVLYITIQVHRTTRLEQRRAIREQVDQINWLASSAGAYDRRNEPQDLTRRLEEQTANKRRAPEMKEILKHRWNQEVEKLVRKAYNSRWEDFRDSAAGSWGAVKSYVKKD
ncbi:hypothetical protein N7468_000195 [Penicillium chermesinum]|uniref:MICOS complex subunit MIC12 n=1 Tax=Penicillium chermesinum TaxID=63820 RepID=A0A9W9PL58_9EURO|nr:uncharacterized protein N7468_000195 [Penicillium chermesinum]KAJ5248744.1 hypothetical protein N7468_000195 [Penicillium chermesinum]